MPFFIFANQSLAIIYNVSCCVKKIRMNWDIIEIIIIGAVCGYVASRILGGEGFGLLGNIFIGVAGGWIGNALVKHFSVSLPQGLIGRIVFTIGGAIVLIVLLELIKKVFLSKPNTRRRR